MFLAVNELLNEKLRFLLIGLVIILVSYLTFFLTALAFGLATSYTQGIDKWDASGIILQKNANNNIGRSLLTAADYSAFVGENEALLGVGGATIDQAEVEDVALFGIEEDSFLAPNVSEGRSIAAPNELVVDSGLRTVGVELDQELRFKGSDKVYTVVGFNERSTFQAAPIAYMQLPEWRALAAELAGMTSMRDDTTVSAVITKGADTEAFTTDEIQWQSIKDFSSTLPGYSEQVLTFGLMIGFLIFIASLVLAIFTYVLTLQKKSIFGVLKAEGVPSKYIAFSVMLQTVILCMSGLVVGVALTVASGLLLGSKVPFLVNPMFFAAIFGLFLFFAVIGSLVSVRSVVKIDPIEAIG